MGNEQIPISHIQNLEALHPFYGVIQATSFTKDAIDVQEALMNLGHSSQEIAIVKNPSELFKKALEGRGGQQATAVFLDEAICTEGNWYPIPTKQDDDPFNRLISQLRIQGISHEFFVRASEDYAVLLRKAGYKNRIYVVSFEPPHYVQDRLKALTTILGEQIDNPINGMLGRYGVSMFNLLSGNQITRQSTLRSEWPIQQGDLIMALSQLLLL